MSSPQSEFERQVVQIAALGVWQIVTGQPMKRKLEQTPSPKWKEQTGLFVTLRLHGQVRGSMGLFESSTTLAETLFDVGQAAATHDSRFSPVTEGEVSHLEIEVALLSEVKKLKTPEDLEVGKVGLIVSRGEKRAALLPHVALEQHWTPEQFLEACCEKATLSHKAWKDPNTLVEYFTSHIIQGGNLVECLGAYV